jgi:hypothetical protein
MEHAEKVPGKKMIRAFQAFSYLPSLSYPIGDFLNV